MCYMSSRTTKLIKDHNMGIKATITVFKKLLMPNTIIQYVIME